MGNPEDTPQFVSGEVSPRQLRLDKGKLRIQNGDECRLNDGILVFEVPIDAALAYPGLSYNVVRAHVGVAFDAEQFNRRLQNLITSFVIRHVSPLSQTDRSVCDNVTSNEGDCQGLLAKRKSTMTMPINSTISDEVGGYLEAGMDLQAEKPRIPEHAALGSSMIAVVSRCTCQGMRNQTQSLSLHTLHNLPWGGRSVASSTRPLGDDACWPGMDGRVNVDEMEGPTRSAREYFSQPAPARRNGRASNTNLLADRCGEVDLTRRESGIRAHLLGAVESAFKALNAVVEVDMKFLYEQTLAQVKEALGDVAFQSACEEGARWSLEEAVKKVLGYDVKEFALFCITIKN
jgi:hypothetical protein